MWGFGTAGGWWPVRCAKSPFFNPIPQRGVKGFGLLEARACGDGGEFAGKSESPNCDGVLRPPPSVRRKEEKTEASNVKRPSHIKHISMEVATRRMRRKRHERRCVWRQTRLDARSASNKNHIWICLFSSAACTRCFLPTPPPFFSPPFPETGTHERMGSGAMAQLTRHDTAMRVTATNVRRRNGNKTCSGAQSALAASLRAR